MISFEHLLTLIWVSALLVPCVGNPLPTMQPAATKAAQGSAPEPREPAAMETQEPAAPESSSTDEDTALPEEEVYWPTEAWRVTAPNATENMLKSAVSQVRQRHPNPRVRLVEDDHGVPWFTSVGAKEIPVEIVPRESDDLWIKVVQESCQSGEYREKVKYGR